MDKKSLGVILALFGLILFLKSQGREIKISSPAPGGGLTGGDIDFDIDFDDEEEFIDTTSLFDDIKEIFSVDDFDQDFTPAPQTLDDLYKEAGIEWGVDWRLLKAIAIVESNENPNAKNPADPSYGLMQVFCVNDGLNAPCKNRFNIQGWENATPERLFDPKTSLFYAAQILKWNLDTYGPIKGIAVYNNWSARNSLSNGPFTNQGYVDKVRSQFAGLTNTVST